MNKFVTAFDAIAGSPFPKNVFFDLLTAFHRTRSKFRLPDTFPLSTPCGYQAVFAPVSQRPFFISFLLTQRYIDFLVYTNNDTTLFLYLISFNLFG